MELLTQKDIESRIYTIRGIQVLLDHDLAEMYHVETRVMNQAVKRNIARFPEDFRFRLTLNDVDNLKIQNLNVNAPLNSRSQFVILNSVKVKQGYNIKHLPYAFTEQGVAMLSSVLRSRIAIEVSIQIMRAFIGMRRFMLHNASVFQRLDHLEIRQWQTDEKINRVFNALENKRSKPDNGIFFDGQIFDAYAFVANIIKSAQNNIILIDNYIDETVFTLLSKRKEGTEAIIYTSNINKELLLDITRHNAQYPPIELKTFAHSHDRFLIIDRLVLYHFGASLKDLGKKWFGFSKMSRELLLEILIKLPR